MYPTALALIAATLLAGPAQALSCLRPSVAMSFQQADESPLPYVMAKGRLTPLPGQTIPAEPANPNDRQGYTLETRFTGHFATRSGFDVAQRVPVTVEVGCAGPWCGGLPTGEHLFFLERRGAGYALSAGPCPQFALTASPEAISQVIDCINGRGCTAP